MSMLSRRPCLFLTFIVSAICAGPSFGAVEDVSPPASSAGVASSLTVAPQLGEIKVEGTVKSVDPAGGKLVLLVSSVMLPAKAASTLDPPRPKIVSASSTTTLLRMQPGTDTSVVPPLKLEEIKSGVSLSAVGKDLGAGKELPARLLAASFPATAVAPAAAISSTVAGPAANGGFADFESGTYEGGTRRDRLKDHLSEFDFAVSSYLFQNQGVGCAAAVFEPFRVGLRTEYKIVYCKGYGLANRETMEPFTENSSCRLASLTKMATAYATLSLVESGNLSLDTKVYDFLGLQPLLTKDAQFDERIEDITVKDCLHMTAGWDREKSGDKTGLLYDKANEFHLPLPYDAKAAVRLLFGRPLDFDPGTKQVYSNECYQILGLVIEKASGMTYLQYLRRTIFDRCGAKTIDMAATRISARKAGEVFYYEPPGTELHDSPYPEDKWKKIRLSDGGGGCSCEAAFGAGGLISSAMDFGKFLSQLLATLGNSGHPIFQEMLKPPLCMAGRSEFYGAGMFINRDQRGITGAHAGVLQATSNMFRILPTGVAVLVMMNSNNKNMDLSNHLCDQLLDFVQ